MFPQWRGKLGKKQVHVERKKCLYAFLVCVCQTRAVIEPGGKCKQKSFFLLLIVLLFFANIAHCYVSSILSICVLSVHNKSLGPKQYLHQTRGQSACKKGQLKKPRFRVPVIHECKGINVFQTKLCSKEKYQTSLIKVCIYLGCYVW